MSFTDQYTDDDEITDAEREQFRLERIARIKAEGAIRRIVCPRCDAQPGEDCHSPQWYVGQFHAGRRALA